MSCVFSTTVLLVLAGSVSAYGDYNRFRRGSAGAYSGYSDGQYYGGTYHAPDNGPAVFNRFGDEPAASSHGPGAPHGQGGPHGQAGGFAAAGSGAGSYGGGSGTYAPYFPFGPDVPPFQNPVEFTNFFQKYFATLSGNLAAAFEKNFGYQRAAFEAAQNAFQSAAQNKFGNAPGPEFYGPGYGSGNGAAHSSASFGPGGGHQSAGIYPENPSNPNIHNRFGESDPKPGGVYGVSSTSFSASSDIDGKKTSHKQATTSINDNGKITTFVVRD